MKDEDIDFSDITGDLTGNVRSRCFAKKLETDSEKITGKSAR